MVKSDKVGGEASEVEWDDVLRRKNNKVLQRGEWELVSVGLCFICSSRVGRPQVLKAFLASIRYREMNVCLI